MRWVLTLFVGIMFLFLYLPIIVLVTFSFNSIAFPYQWESFSLVWYYELFASYEIWQAVLNSCIVAISAMSLSLLMALLFVFYAPALFGHVHLKSLIGIFYANLMIPEIVLAVGLLSFFVICGAPLGLTTLIAGHTVLGFGYTVPILYTRFAEIDPHIIEASLDLGASTHQTLVRIILPLMVPAVVASGLLVFIISFDDFLISFFCTGTSAMTLPIYIYSMIHAGVSPTINALSTLMLTFSSVLVLLFFSFQRKTSVF